MDLFDNGHVIHTNKTIHKKASTNKQALGPMKAQLWKKKHMGGPNW